MVAAYGVRPSKRHSESPTARRALCKRARSARTCRLIHLLLGLIVPRSFHARTFKSPSFPDLDEFAAYDLGAGKSLQRYHCPAMRALFGRFYYLQRSQDFVRLNG